GREFGSIVSHGPQPMQHPPPGNPHSPPARHPRTILPRFGLFLPAAVVLGAFVLALGCGGPATTETKNEQKPYSGARLRVSCPDAAFAAAIAPMTQSWSGRTGAKVEVSAARMT